MLASLRRIGVFAIVLTALPLWAQTPQFRVTSELIQVHAVVTDKSGAPARGLTRDDFVVTEDGVRQEIAQFAFVDLPAPVKAASAKPSLAPATTASNEIPRNARLYVLVLDALHVDPTQTTNVRRYARQFVNESIGADDAAAVVTIGGMRNQPFTRDKARLLRAIDGFVGQKPRAATLSIARDARNRPAGSAAHDPETDAKANAARVMFEMVKRVCESLGENENYRRSVLLFSQGIEVDTSDLVGGDQRSVRFQGVQQPSRQAGLVLEAQRDMLIAARRANVAIYTIDPRGSTSGQESIMEAETPNDPLTGRPIIPTTGLTAEAARSQGTLRVFAEETGGVAVVNTNSFDRGFKQIVQSTSAYYVLAYKPTTPGRDGRYHRINVEVKSRDLKVVARKGYFAAAAAPAPTDTAVPNGPSSRMLELLSSQLPVAGLGMHATAGPIGVSGDKVLVALVLDLDLTQVKFSTLEDSPVVNSLEVGFVTLDGLGKAQAGAVGRLPLPSLRRGLRYAAEIPLVPGQYQIRAAVFETGGSTAGSAIVDIDVPRLDRTPLEIVSVLLTSQSAQRLPSAGRLSAIADVMPALPTATYEFYSGETVTALVGALGKDAKPPLKLTAVLKTTGGEAKLTLSGPPDAPPQAGVQPLRLLTIPIPLADIPAGEYVLEFEVQSAGRRSAKSAVPITVK